MMVKACIAVIPSSDLEKSLRFWVEGLGLTMDQEMRREDKLIGCAVHNEHVWFWLNETDATANEPGKYEGITLYWTPTNIQEARERLKNLGFDVSEIEVRDYGQTEFFVTDDDGHTHCFGIATKA